MSNVRFSTDKKLQPVGVMKTRSRKSRRPSVAAILRDAYMLHMPDRETRLAVRACLRMV